MVKLTVLYNLPEGADHEAFLAWRTGPHQARNASVLGVLKTDFYAVCETPLGPPAYRYITEAYFATMADLEASFFSEDAQEQLKQDLKAIASPLFLISEEVVTTVP